MFFFVCVFTAHWKTIVRIKERYDDDDNKPP